MKKNWLCIIMMLYAAQCISAEYEEVAADTMVSYVSMDSDSTAALEIMPAKPGIATTKEYAQYVMDSYRGFKLRPVVDLRGFSFSYVDNAPCAGLVTYFDGRSYLMFRACGNIPKNDIALLFKKASGHLKLSEILKQQSVPHTY